MEPCSLMSPCIRNKLPMWVVTILASCKILEYLECPVIYSRAVNLTLLPSSSRGVFFSSLSLPPSSIVFITLHVHAILPVTVSYSASLVQSFSVTQAGEVGPLPLPPSLPSPPCLGKLYVPTNMQREYICKENTAYQTKPCKEAKWKCRLAYAYNRERDVVPIPSQSHKRNRNPYHLFLIRVRKPTGTCRQTLSFPDITGDETINAIMWHF